MEYRIIKNAKPQKLEQAVKELLDDGWQLLGGASAVGRVYVQTLTKQDTKPDVKETTKPTETPAPKKRGRKPKPVSEGEEA